MIGGKMVLKSFRLEMMTDKHISSFFDYEDSGYCFNGQRIDGGICYFLWDKTHENVASYTYIPEKTERFTVKRFLSDGGTDIVIRDYRRQSIIAKVTNVTSQFKEIVSLTQPFGIRKDLFNSPQNYPQANLMEETYPSALRIYGVKGIKGGARRTIGYIRPETVSKNHKWIDKYKLFFTTSYSTNAIVPPESIIGNPGDICTETFLVVGPFGTQTEQLNCKKYFYTSLFKVLLYFGRGTMQVSKDVFRFVPLQDFSANSDINWSQSVVDIDHQLYAKYGLTEEEITFIESMIKPM